MKRINIATILVLLLVVIFNTSVAWADKDRSYIGELSSSVSSASIDKSESTTFMTSFKVLGDVRNNFNGTVWLSLIGAGKTLRYSITYAISVREDVRFGFDKEIVKTKRYTRVAKIALGPNVSLSGFRVEITLEDGTVVLPESIEDAQALMFDVSKSFDISGKALESGNHQMFAKVEARWSGYVIPGSATKDKDSPRVKVKVK